MVIVDKGIKNGCKKGVFISNGYSDGNVGAISYDLTIDSIISNSGKSVEESTYELAPHDTIFVKTKEEICIPKDYMGIVGEKNSVMRQGLVVSAPFYQPGHKTYCFLRVQNISSSIITLSEGKQIAQILFSSLSDTPDVPYSEKNDASFNNENEYKGFGKYKSKYSKEIKKVEKAKEDLDSKVQMIYSNVLVFMGIIAAIFSLITINFEAFKGESLDKMRFLSMNLSIVFSISFLMGIILSFTTKSFQKNKALHIIYWVCVLAVFVVNLCIVFFQK